MAQASGKSRRAALTLCNKHGIERGNLSNVKQVRVSIPKGKNEKRFGGCPICKREAQS
jgi:hypothetical protein